MSDKSKVQCVYFKDDGKWNTSKARRWLKNHSYHPIQRCRKEKGWLKYTIKMPGDFKNLRITMIDKNKKIRIASGMRIKQSEVSQEESGECNEPLVLESQQDNEQ